MKRKEGKYHKTEGWEGDGDEELKKMREMEKQFSSWWIKTTQDRPWWLILEADGLRDKNLREMINWYLVLYPAYLFWVQGLHQVPPAVSSSSSANAFHSPAFKLWFYHVCFQLFASLVALVREGRQDTHFVKR